MAQTGFLVLSIASIAVMLVALFLVIKLRRQIPGGTVGSTWKFLSALVIMFTAGYLSTPFFPMIPAEYQNLIVGFIFFFGAIFVVVVVRLFHKVAVDLGL